MTPEQRLKAGLEQLDIKLSDSKCELLLAYLSELLRWNKTYNLTAVRDANDMVVRHLLDSISVLPYMQGDNCLDLGTGAGLPGMVLAIINPEQKWTLLDSNGKKTRFLTHVRITLKLENITIVNARAESWRTEELFNGVISRAFTELIRFAEFAQPFCASENSHILAMIGKRPDVVKGDIVAACRVNAVIPVQIPFDEADRHLVQLHPAT